MTVGSPMRKRSADIPSIPGSGFVVVDTETTGFHRDARIIEIALVFLDPEARVEASFTTLLRGDGTVGNRFAQKTHGITQQALKRAPAFDDIAGQLAEVLERRVPVAHNAAFDAARIDFEFETLGLVSPSSFACTMVLGQELGHGRLSLKNAIAYFGLPAVNAHRAAEDADAAAQLFRRYLLADRAAVGRHIRSVGRRMPR